MTVTQAREALMSEAALTQRSYPIMEAANAYALAVHVEACRNAEQIVEKGPGWTHTAPGRECGRDGWYCETGEKYR